MNIYKVLFEHNKPISAMRVSEGYAHSVKIEKTDGKREVKWITIMASDATDGIICAAQVIKDLSRFLS